MIRFSEMRFLRGPGYVGFGATFGRHRLQLILSLTHVAETRGYVLDARLTQVPRFAPSAEAKP